MEDKYKIGDLVWAKIRGFPWWPAIVSINIHNIKIGKITIIAKGNNNKEKKYTVYFIGDNSMSDVLIDKIKLYEEGLIEHGNSSKKALLTSIKYADKIRKGELTFQQVKSLITNPDLSSRSDSEEDEDSNSDELEKRSDDSFKEEEYSHSINSENNIDKLNDNINNIKDKDNQCTDSDEVENRSDHNNECEVKAKKMKLDELTESLIFIKVNTPGNSNFKTILNKLKEIETLVIDLSEEQGIYQVS